MIENSVILIDEVELLLNHYQQKGETLRQELEEAKQKRNEIDKYITELENTIRTIAIRCETLKSQFREIDPNSLITLPIIKDSINSKSQGSNQYNKEWSKTKKAEFILRREQRPMTTRQLTEAISKFEPDLLGESNERFGRYQKDLSTALRQSIDSGKLFTRLENKEGNFEYGLIEWDKDKKIKNRYTKEAV
jgi:hypothetical protein